jgi:hypothetical protein
MLDSLVRVSRRVVMDLFTNIKRTMARSLHREERTPSLIAQTKLPFNLTDPTTSPDLGFDPKGPCPYDL